MVVKRVLCPARVRKPPPQFSWVDQRLVRERYIERCDANALALYLFLLTVAKWARTEQYRARRSASRASQLDPFKPDVVRWLEDHPLSAAQIFQRLREVGYPGGYLPYVREHHATLAQEAAEHSWPHVQGILRP